VRRFTLANRPGQPPTRLTQQTRGIITRLATFRRPSSFPSAANCLPFPEAFRITNYRATIAICQTSPTPTSRVDDLRFTVTPLTSPQRLQAAGTRMSFGDEEELLGIKL